MAAQPDLVSDALWLYPYGTTLMSVKGLSPNAELLWYVGWLCVCVFIDRSAPVLVAADDLDQLDDDEAQYILENTLKPPKYDPLDFWNHVQSHVRTYI